jgi:hypothetical protein
MLKVIILWIIKFYNIIFMRNYKNIIYNWKRKFGKNRHFWRKKRGLDLLEFCMQATSFKGKKYNEGR